MIEEYIASMVQESIMNELAPYIVVGTLTLIMFVGYHITNRVETTISRRKGSSNG